MPTKINILSQVKGMSNKTPCVVATTGDTSFSAISIIDGITLSNNDRVLVWKQSNATQNGIYIFSGGTLTRALDSNVPDDFIQGMQILVISGNTYGETLFYQTSVVSTIGSSNINFGIFGGLNGTSGTTGTTGSSGESGSSGTSGTSGTSGSSGSSGTSGTSPASQISGSGTVNYIPKFTGTTNLGNSIIFDNGSNVGIGVTPSAWDATGAGGPIIQIGRGLIFGADTETRYIFNAFYGTGNFRYIASSIAASKYQQTAGEHRWYNAPSGTAGNPITFTQAMTLGSNNGLSIGTTTTAPANGLLVAGAATFSSSVNIGTSLASGNALTISNLTNSRQFQFGYSTGAGYNYFQVYDGTSFQPFNINNTIHILGNGNVGIGTTSPSYKLVSEGSGNAFMYAALSSSIGIIGNWVGYLYGYIGSTYQKGATIFESIDANGRGKFHIALNNVANSSNVSISDAKFTIIPGGNVGIGTTSPVANLQINSSTTSPATMAFSQSVSNTSAQRGQFAFYNSNISTVASIIAQAVTDNVGTDLEFYTRPVGGLLTKNMVILNNGNVGIGTGSPLSPLSVNASNAKLATGFWHVTLFDNTPMNTGVGGGFTFGGLKSATANEVFAAIDSYKENATPNNAAGAMRFHTQPSDGSGVVERMRITSGGNVGIGTTNTWAKLVVNNGTNLNLAIKLGQSDPTAMMLNAHNDAVNANIPMEFRATKFNFELGNVGIGTTSPGSYSASANKLVVGTTSGNNGITIVGGTTGFSSIYFADGTTGNEAYRGYFEYAHSSDYLSFGTAASERMRISSTGAVTINNLGSGTVTASSGTLTTSSDSTYKIDAGFIDSALDKVMNLKPRYFYWNDKSGLPMDVRQLGFYAQEVNSAIGEEAANTPKENIPWGINDRSLIAFLTKAIQEQQSQIDILKQEIINLKNK